MPTTEDSSHSGASLLEAFSTYFDLSLALSRKQRDQVYQIRYRVYCEEFGFEPASIFNNQQEIDEFDCQSIHCLVTHKASGLPAGCVRVVMVEDSDMMPMEAHVGDSLDRHFIDSFRQQRDTLCEISRLAVDSRFRRRRHEGKSQLGDIEAFDFSSVERRTFPLIALALMLGAGAVAETLDKKNCFAIMEPVLSRLMHRTGIDFQRVGADFEYRGTRAPYFGNMDELISNASPELGLYFNVILKQFAAVLVAARTDSGIVKMAGSCSSRPRHTFAFPTGQYLLEYSLRCIAPPAWSHSSLESLA